jgi:hypothetical protein
MQNGCKQAQTTGICNSCQDGRLHKKLGDLGKHENNKEKVQVPGWLDIRFL